MRMRSILLLLVVACAGKPGKGQESFVHDVENVLTLEEYASLDSVFRAHELRAGNEILLVTHPTFNDLKAVDFAVGYGESNGVGKEDLDNGVVIAFSQARREVFIATGYGTERILHDSTCQRIVDSIMVPHFKEDRHFDGLWAGGLAIVQFLERPENKIQPR
jgi:uncharacterized protein